MVGGRQAIPPYWTQFGSFFLYPLRGEALLVCAGFGLLSGLASPLFFIGLVGPLVELLVLVLILRYGYGVLERTARGYLNSNPVFLESDHNWTPYKQLAVIVAGVVSLIFMAGIAGFHVAMILLVLFLMLLPANIMILAVTNDIVESMSPPRLWDVAHGIGLPYLGLCACLLLLSGSGSALQGLLIPVIPMAFIMVMVGFVNAYFMIVMFRLMGYTLYQYHEILGFDADVAFDRQDPAVSGKNPAEQAAEHFAGLIKEGHFDEAIALTREEIARDPDDTGANQRLHRLLLAMPDRQEEMLKHAIRWLPVLLRKKQDRQAAEVLETVWKYQPDLMPTVANHILPLAQAYFEMRHFESAGRLINGFDRRFPGHRDIPAVYLIGARLLIDHMREEAQARRLLDMILTRFPDNPIAPEATRLIALLDRLKEFEK